VAADSEYRRRHPEEKLPPLRSAEPAKPAQEERRALIPNGGADYQTPQWVADLAARNREARERLDELKNVRVPGEDHEWEDEGQAWPGQLVRQREAILQPPRPEIRPAEQVAEMAREPRRRSCTTGLSGGRGQCEGRLISETSRAVHPIQRGELPFV
jgi:hypothetical protein